MPKSIPLVLMLSAFAWTCSGCHAAHAQASVSQSDTIDQRSYRLGSLAAFSEVVSLGIKRMALSAATTRREMDAIFHEANQIANEHDVKLYREKDFPVTDLFPESATKGKEVLVIYRGSTLDAYLALKAEKATLVEAGRYSGDARHRIAYELGKLLSYPDDRIEALIAENAPER